MIPEILLELHGHRHRSTFERILPKYLYIYCAEQPERVIFPLASIRDLVYVVFAYIRSSILSAQTKEGQCTYGR